MHSFMRNQVQGFQGSEVQGFQERRQGQGNFHESQGQGFHESQGQPSERRQVQCSQTSTTSFTQVNDFHYEDFTQFLSPPAPPESQQQQQTSINWNSVRDQSFQDIFEGLPNINQIELVSTPYNISSENKLPHDLQKIISTDIETNDEVRTTGEEFNEQRKRFRSAKQSELHNMSEKKRRTKIKEKIKTLEELIPNCNKSDRASVLDDAVEYTKALKHQAHMMSMARAAMWQQAAAGIQSNIQQIPQFMPCMPMGYGMGMGMGIGMVNMGYPPGASLPFQPSSTSAPNMPLIYPPEKLPFPEFQVQPFMVPQVIMPTVGNTTSSTTSIIQPQFLTGFSSTFNPANQGDQSSSASQFLKETMDDTQKIPLVGEKYKVFASHIVTPQSLSGTNVVDGHYFSSGAVGGGYSS